jgi:cell wall-associated NlpC family hydrolase
VVHPREAPALSALARQLTPEADERDSLLRARTLFALGFTTFGFAFAPAVSMAATGGAGTSTKQSSAKQSADDAPAPTPAPAPATPQDQAGGAAFGSVPALLHPTVSGDVGVIRDGIAYAPTGAPLEVQQAIWAANTLRGKPYVYGGGHQSFRSRGYDCSGTVSFALHAAGLLDSPLDSGSFMKWGERGRGAWITVYTNPGHAWAIIAGMRLDTSGPGESGPRWRTVPGSTRGFKARHPELF